MKIVLIYTASWLGMVILAILNGAIREKVFGKLMDELTAHQLSTLAGIILFGVYIWILTGWFRIESSRQALLIIQYIGILPGGIARIAFNFLKGLFRI